MNRYRQKTLGLASMGLTALVVLAACGGAAVTSVPATAVPSAMVDHSPMPSASMMVHESPTASVAIMVHSPMPSASMTAHESPTASVATPVSTGAFHAVDGSATGTVALYHMPDGTFVITFEDFSIGTAAYTDVILVSNKDITKDADIDKTAIVDLGPLKGVSGMQDFAVPASADAMTLHTVVLWDTQMAHAVAAAPLH